MTINIGFASDSFEFKSKYPNLHLPAYRASDTNLVDPSDLTNRFLDGEWALLDGVTRQLRRPTAGDLATPSVQMRLGPVLGNRGRSDLQASNMIPQVVDDGYEFVTRLHSANQPVPVAIVAGDRMEVVLSDVNMVIDGVVPTTFPARAILRPTTTDNDYFVAVCEVPPDARGWARFIARRGQV